MCEAEEYLYSFGREILLFNFHFFFLAVGSGWPDLNRCMEDLKEGPQGEDPNSLVLCNY